MKKLLAILVVFTMVVGAVSAVDIGGTVFGHVNVMEGSTADDSEITASGNMDRLRLEGSGAAGDSFGGWIRVEAPSFGFDYDEDEDDFSFSFGNGWQGLAWWKPIDQLKLTIGQNSDGIWGKEGVTGWMFNQMPYDSGIAMGSGNIWGWGETVSGLQTRFAFFHGYGDNRAALEITPMDILSINIAIPFFMNDEFKEVFKAIIAQVSVNLDFGNIAFTYNGASHFGDPAIFAYFGGAFGDLGLDVGIGFHLGENENHFFAGLGLKYTAGDFGVKLRTTLGLPMEDNQDFGVLVDVLPYYAISDNLSAFLNAGIGISGPDSDLGLFINPYLRVGAEWGPTFYFGVKIAKAGDDITFAVPVSLMVSF